MANDMVLEVTGGILVTFALALLAFIANRSGRVVIAALLAAAAWLFAGLDVWIWFPSLRAFLLVNIVAVSESMYEATYTFLIPS